MSVHRILIVEDEETLRLGMMRALGKLPHVEVMGAGSMREALAQIDRAPPHAVISDLDLPDRFGGELLGELDRRSLRIPVTFVSAFTRSLGERVPRSPRVKMVDKPISLERLRELAMQALSFYSESELPPPFGPSDYLQLACLGRHSVVITQRRYEHDEHAVGRIVVWGGQLWAAYDEQGEGEEAFRRIVASSGSVFRCHTLERDPGPRQFYGSWEMHLLDALRLADEERSGRAHEPRGVESGARGEVLRGQVLSTSDSDLSSASPSGVSNGVDPSERRDVADGSDGGVGLSESISTQRTSELDYEQAFEAALEALLARDYRAAAELFGQALRARPGDPLAAANLERLRVLGHVHQGMRSGGAA